MPPRRSRFNPVQLDTGPPGQAAAPEQITPRTIRPPRTQFGNLRPATQKRYLNFYSRNYGYDRQTVELEYNRGTLPNLTAARGHAQTPERRISREQATPAQLQRYESYFAAKGPIRVLVQDQGELLLDIPGRSQRQLVYRHWLAVRNYWSTGTVTDWTGYGISFNNILGAADVAGIVSAGANPRRMRRRGLAWFVGKGVTDANGTFYQFMTNLDQLDEFWRTNDTEAIFYSLYPNMANSARAA